LAEKERLVARKPILVVVEGPLTGKEFAIGDGYTIGRADDCSIVTGDQTTSRLHARIVKEKDGIRILDNESANGLLVNKRKVKSHYLRDGDRVTMGETTFQVQFQIDPKDKRRNFLIFMILLLVIGGGGSYYIIQQQRELQERTTPVDRVFDQVYKDDKYGYEVMYSSAFQTPPPNTALRRAWDTGFTDDLWTRDPRLANGMITEAGVFDSYSRVRFMETINPDRYEFVRMTVEVLSGLKRTSTLLDYSLSNVYVPTSDGLVADPKDVVSGTHPDYGPYEEAVFFLQRGTPEAGYREYIKQRVYVVGQRRFLLSVATNATMRARTEVLFQQFFDGMKIDVAAQQLNVPLTDEQIFDKGNALFVEASRLEGGAPTLNVKYKALLRFMAAYRELKQMSREPKELSEIVKKGMITHNNLQRELLDRRDRIRDFVNRNRFTEAFTGLDEISAVLKLADDPYKPSEDDKEEWAAWVPKANDFVTQSRTVERGSSEVD